MEPTPTGGIADGEACNEDNSCASGYCDGMGGGEGICKTRIAPGGTCDENSDCTSASCVEERCANALCKGLEELL
jgi:hypothetical protein